MQTISAGDVDGVPGGVTQVKEVSAALIRMAKLRNITLVIIGHVTKDGTIAGPRVLEHLVDVVLHFEGERTSRLRMVRAVKNRFGPVDEVGCFDLSAEGIVGDHRPDRAVPRHPPRPGARHLRRGRRWRAAARCSAEVQALVTPTAAERPRRTTSGVDSSRVAMILAVLQQHAGIRLHSHDVFVSSVGGARLHRAQQRPRHRAGASPRPAAAGRWRRNVVAIGELGLSGELRRVRDLGVAARRGRPDGLPLAVVPGRVAARHAPASSRVARRHAGRRRRPRRARALSLLEAWSKDDSRRPRPDSTRLAPRGFPRATTTRPRLRATLAGIAPGTSLRDGLERILRGRTGALIVLGHDKTVEAHRAPAASPSTCRSPPPRLRELAKMDGAHRRSTATSPGSTAPTCT